jgi:hypothetical protein
MKAYINLDSNNKVIGVKSVNDNYNGDGIEIAEYNTKLYFTTYNSGTFQGYYITLTADKSTITADGVDKAIVTASISNYDGTAATDYATGITFDVNGTQQTVIPVNGEASIEFNSSVAGSYVIKTVNDVIRNGEVTIIAS